MKRSVKGLSVLEFVCILGVVAIFVLVLAKPLYELASNALKVDADHSNIRQAYSLLSQARIADTSPVDGSQLPTEGEPIVFYYLVGGLCEQQDENPYRRPERAYLLTGTDGAKGDGCRLKSAGRITSGVPDPDALEDSSFTFCGAHIRGNYIKLIYYPGGAQGSGKWLLALEG